MHRFPLFVASIALTFAAITGCGGGDLVLPSDGIPAELRIDGDNQQGAVGAALPESLEVSVRDSRGEPVPGHTVTFDLESEVPQAQVTPESARTRSDGVARAMWVLGATSGTQTVVARVERGAGTEPLEARFTARVDPGGAARIEVADGNDQSATVGSVVDPIVVRVTDEFGNPVAGVPVVWQAATGSVDPGSSTTGTDGLASTTWTLGTTAGPQSVTASSAGLSETVIFTAVARAGSPDRLLRVSGDGQTAAPGNQLQDDLVVRLLDQQGNGVPNRAVSWVVATGGGTVSPATSTTDADGRASTRWTLGAQGQNSLNAVVSGVGVVGFTATANGGGGGGGGGGTTAARLEFRVQPSDIEEDETMSPAVEVAVLDQAGNLVTDREFDIKLELVDSRGRVRADGTDRTSGGVATFTIEVSRRGEYRLRASTDGLPSVESDQFEVEDD